VLFLGLGVSFVLLWASSQKLFLPALLGLSAAFKNKQKRTTEYENHKKVRMKNSQLQSKIYGFFIFNLKKSAF